MTTLFFDRARMYIPKGVKDLESFRSWVHAEQFPKQGRISFIHGEVWIDMSKEQLYSHNQVKTEYSRVISTLIKADGLGCWCSDGMRLSNPGAELSCVPDGIFFSLDSLANDRIRYIEGASGGCIELEGTPEVVLEVVSDSSEKKDSQALRELYWKAGIQEYWIVDARGERLEFEILRHGVKGYTGTRKSGGWLQSKVFGNSFRLVRKYNPLGHPVFTLEVR